MARNPLLEISNHTLIGGAVRMLAKNAGAPAQGNLLVTGAVTSGETYTLGGIVFELLGFTTDTGADTAGGEFNNTTNPLVDVTVTGHGAALGDFMMVETEFFEVIKVTDANTVNLARGALGSLVVAHADAEDIFLNDSSPVAGTQPIGLTDPATPATVAVDIILSHNANGARGYEAQPGSAGSVVFTADGGLAVPTSETMANGEFLNGAAMDIGTPEGQGMAAVGSREMTAAEDTANAMNFAFNFPVVDAIVTCRTAAGAVKVIDSTVTILGNTVSVEGGGTPPVATDVVTVLGLGYG